MVKPYISQSQFICFTGASSRVYQRLWQPSNFFIAELLKEGYPHGIVSMFARWDATYVQNVVSNCDLHCLLLMQHLYTNQQVLNWLAQVLEQAWYEARTSEYLG